MDQRPSRPGPGILFVMPAWPVLCTERLQLEPLSAADFRPLRTLFSREPVRRFLLDGQVPDDDWVTGVIADSAADFERRELGLWTAREHGEAAWCGLVGYRDFHDPPLEELVYALEPEACGKGFATEMASAVIDHAFELGRQRISASVDLPNEDSNRVLRGLGFSEVRREPCPPGCSWDQIHWELVRK